MSFISAGSARQWRFPLKYKIALFSAALVAFLLILFWLLTAAQLQRTMQQQADNLGTTLAAQTADSVRELVLANDLLGLNVVLDQQSRNPGIRRIQVYNIDDELIAASSGSGETAEGRVISGIYSAEISLQDAVAGNVRLELDTSDLAAGWSAIFYYFWGTLGLGILLAGAASFALASHIARPVLDATRALRETDENLLPAQPGHGDEMAALAETCAELLRRHRENDLSRYSAATLKQHADDRIPARLTASVFVIRVVNINTAIELLHPTTLSRLLNEYFSHLKQAAMLYGGEIRRFSGDSVMVSFDIRASDDHAYNAVCCARLFQMLMQEINRSHRAANAQALEFRLAIHSGEVFFTADAAAGSIETGHETLIGNVIETGYHLCRKSSPGQLTVSETAFSHAGGGERLDTADNIEITMPADNMSFMAYTLAPPRDEQREVLEQQCRRILRDEDSSEWPE